MFGVVEGISVAAKRNSAAPALITGNRALGYGDLIDMVARIGNHLADRLPRRSKLFLNIGDPDLRLIITIAAIHSGMIPFVLLDIGEQKDEIDYDYVVGSLMLQIPDLAVDLMIDQSVLGGRLSDRTLRDFPEGADDDILMVGSTTGTTGRRKLICPTWRTFRGSMQARGIVPGVGEMREPEWARVRAGDRRMATLGDVTYAGTGLAILTLMGGATFVRAAREPVESLRIINAAQVTDMIATPGTMASYLDCMAAKNIRCPSLRMVMLGGSLADEGLIERIEQHIGCELVVSYGSSEAGSLSIGRLSSRDFRFGYVGEIYPDVNLVTAGSREDPARIVVIRNNDIHVPYYVDGNPMPTDETFYTLPDLGYAEGTKLYLVGRDDEVYNISGNKIAYSTIEQALRRNGARDVAIVAADAIGDHAGLVIGLVVDEGVDLARLRATVADIIRAPRAAEHLHLFRLETVPRNAFGKTDRKPVITAFLKQNAEAKPGESVAR